MTDVFVADGEKSAHTDGSSPLLAGGAATFQPFRKDPAKQDRYQRYLALVKQGAKGERTNYWFYTAVMCIFTLPLCVFLHCRYGVCTVFYVAFLYLVQN
jgi:hypothetical protein